MPKAFLRYLPHSDDFSLFIRMNERPFEPVVIDVLEALSEKVPKDVPHGRFGPVSIPEGHAVAQAILDAAWEQGLRPTGFADVKNETAAIKGHLADMRALAFGSLKIEGPK